MAENRVPTGSRHLEWVTVGEMRISARAQRDHSKPGAVALIEEIASNFDPDKLGVLTVNERDGTYWVVDGGHRLTALGLMGYGDQKTQCWVYHGLTEEQEADLFLDLNNVRVVNAMDKFKVAVVAERAAEADVDRIVRSLGLGVGPGRNNVSCVSALLKVYHRGGAKVLATTVRIVRDAYGAPGYAARVVEGIGLFVASYENTFDEGRLVSKLSRKFGGVNGLLGRAEQIKSSHGAPLPQAVAAATVETYNQGRGGGKLTGWWTKLAEEEKVSA